MCVRVCCVFPHRLCSTLYTPTTTPASHPYPRLRTSLLPHHLAVQSTYSTRKDTTPSRLLSSGIISTAIFHLTLTTKHHTRFSPAQRDTRRQTNATIHHLLKGRHATTPAMNSRSPSPTTEDRIMRTLEDEEGDSHSHQSHHQHHSRSLSRSRSRSRGRGRSRSRSRGHSRSRSRSKSKDRERHDLNRDHTLSRERERERERSHSPMSEGSSALSIPPPSPPPAVAPGIATLNYAVAYGGRASPVHHSLYGAVGQGHSRSLGMGFSPNHSLWLLLSLTHPLFTFLTSCPDTLLGVTPLPSSPSQIMIHGS